MKQTVKSLIIISLSLVFIISCMPVYAVADTAYTAPTNLPAIYINLDNNFPQDQIDKETYRTGKISVVGADGYSDIIEASGAMKGRGNYSWTAEKKPYNIKFDSKTDVLGMGKAKKWVLIANYWDKTMLRNYITLKMASDLGLGYTPEVRFIDLYINGVYRGNYLLTEKIEIGKERVNVDGENGGVLFEIEQSYRHTDHTYCHETPSGVHIMYSEPEYEDDNPGTIFNTEFIQNMMAATNPILDRVDTSLSKGYSEYSKYIDVDSFVNWYIVNEFCKNYDSQFVSSCYCYYDPADGLLHMGPVWDYDTCYGNQSANGYGVPEGYLISTGSPWYRMLTADNNFMDLVKSRWTEVKSEGKIQQALQNVITGSELIAQSQVLNNIAWPKQLLDGGPRGDSSQTYYTYKEELDYLKKFIAARTVWLDEQWNTSPDSTVNKLDTLETMAYGLFMGNSMAVDGSYFDKAYELFNALSESEKTQLPSDVLQLFYDYEVYAVESAIQNASEISSYSQKGIVQRARALYDSLSEEKKTSVTNYADLLAAEQKVLGLAADMGIANVTRDDVTDRVIASSVTGVEGYGNENYNNIFDGLTSTKYCVGFSGPLSVQWEMSAPTSVGVYAIATANDFPVRNPESWILEGSNDQNGWTVVDTVPAAGLSQNPYTYKEFFCDTPDAYRYYRITFTKTAGTDGSLQFSEMLLGSAENKNIEAVINAIEALGSITDLSRKADVEATRALYDALSETDKICVSNYSKLLDAEIAIINLSGDKTAINRVISFIAALPAELTIDNRQEVLTARVQYDLLSEAQRTFVTNYSLLTSAETHMAALIEIEADKAAAQSVDDLIAAIGPVTSKNQREEIKGARSAYNGLTPAQKKYVKNLAVLVAAESALSQIDAVPNTIETIAAISETVTRADGPVARKARALYDLLSAEDQAKVTNYAKLTFAETQLRVLYDAFDVDVHLSGEGRNTFSNTPWMNISNLSSEQQTATTDAMADEIWYQYYEKGYQFGLTNGYYEISNHAGYFIVQSDVHIFDGTLTASDNVGNPWGSEGRYWACVISPFAGMAFSVNGYMVVSYGYGMPLCDPFVYNGSVYQVYNDGVRYHENIPLVKDTAPAFATFEYYPGSGVQDNNTFVYAYAKYSQENKWNNKVLGVPYENVVRTADNSILYQRFYSASGDTYLAASADVVQNAVADSGSPAGAFAIAGHMQTAFSTLGDNDEARFEVTGAPVADSVSTDAYTYQNFEKGTLVYTPKGSAYFMSSADFNQSIDDAAALEESIEALPAFSSMQKADYEQAVALDARYSGLSDFGKELVSADLVQKLEQALTWVLLGDVDKDKNVTASDVVALRAIIAAGNPTEEQIAAGDMNGDRQLTEEDVKLLLAELGLTLGDVNGDTQVGALDIMVMRKVLLNGNATDEQLAVGDLDGNGALGPVDIMKLRKLLLQRS